MATYTIIGGDNKEYGPISAEDIRQWIKEGRLSQQTSIKSDTDTQWRTLGTLPEFADAFQPATPPTIGALPGAAPSIPLPAAGSTDYLNSDYDLDIMGCFSEGWELLKNNFGVLWGSVMIYFAIEFAVGLVGSIPLIGPFFSLANFVANGPLLGGVLYLFVRVNRGEPATVGDMFAGFSRWFGHLFLAMLLQTIFMGLCLLPVLIVAIIKFLPLAGELKGIQPGSQLSPDVANALVSATWVLLPIGLVCMLPVIYLSTCWIFSLPLILDKQVDFWTGLRGSMKMVNKHWWAIFGLMVLTGLLNIAGALACCIGLFFSVPLGYAALVKAYETIFGTQKN